MRTKLQTATPRIGLFRVLSVSVMAAIVLALAAVLLATAKPAEAALLAENGKFAPGLGSTVTDVEEGATVQKSQVEGGATGDGPADDAECEKLAGDINAYVDVAVVLGSYEGGIDLDHIDMYLDAADRVEQKGLSRGCFFMHGTSPGGGEEQE